MWLLFQSSILPALTDAEAENQVLTVRQRMMRKNDVAKLLKFAASSNLLLE